MAALRPLRTRRRSLPEFDDVGSRRCGVAMQMVCSGARAACAWCHLVLLAFAGPRHSKLTSARIGERGALAVSVSANDARCKG